MKNAGPEAAATIRRKVSEMFLHPEYKEEVRDFVFSNGGCEYSESRLQEYVGKAVSALEFLPQSEENDYLVSIAAFTAGRDK